MDFSNLGDWVVPVLLVVYYLFSAFKNRSKGDKTSEKHKLDPEQSSDAQEASRRIREEVARKIADRQGKLAREQPRAQPKPTILRPVVYTQAESAFTHGWDTAMKTLEPIPARPVLVEKETHYAPCGMAAASSEVLGGLRSAVAIQQAVVNAEILARPRGLRGWDY